MNEQLWAGPDLKHSYAFFHLERMHHILGPADWTDGEIAQISSGLIVDRGQQRALYPHFDAFLAAAHAIAPIIQCSFGHDDHWRIKSWFNALDQNERERRKEFKKRLEPFLAIFHALPLSNARNISFHRLGHADVTVRCSGRYGVVHVGSPTQYVPPAEHPSVQNPQAALMARAVPLELRPGDVTIDGKPLLEVCHDYLEEAGKLIAQARVIAAVVHGSRVITAPPDE